MKYGYARVSTCGQSLETQLQELEAVGCHKIFQEKVSGARSNREELAKLVARLKKGDTLVVCRLDRLARSTKQLLILLDDISSRGAVFHSLKDSWANTDSPQGLLMLTVLASLAQYKVTMIRDRTTEGRKLAIANNVKFGRKPKLTPHQRSEALQRKRAGETLSSIARSFNVSHSMISRLT